MAPRFAPHGPQGLWDRPNVVMAPSAVAALTSRPPASGRDRLLRTDEAQRLDHVIGAALGAPGPLPPLKQVAALAEIGRGRLRRAIGSVDRAADGYVDERISTARRCAAMPSRWYPALSELSADIVTHRLYVLRIIADIVPDGDRRLPTAALLHGLAAMLDDDLAYNVRRLGVLDDPAEVRAFVADVGQFLSFDRLLDLRDAIGDDRQLERRLNTELHVDMTRYRMFERWSDRRHDWFSSTAAPQPIAS